MATINDLKSSLSLDGYDSEGNKLNNSNNRNTDSQTKNPNLSWYNPLRYASDVAIGLGQAGQGIESAPYNIANMISPRAGSAVASFLPPQNIDFGKIFGVNEPSIGDKLLQGAAQFAPYGMGAALRSSMSPFTQALAAGGSFGATQSDNPLSGALEGSLAAGLGAGASRAINPLTQSLGNAVAKSALGQKIGQMTQAIRFPENAQGYQNIMQNYKSIVGSGNEPGIENKLHQIKNSAAEAADQYGYKFDNSDYLSALRNKIGELQKQSINNPALSSTNKEAIEMLQNLANSKSDTFSDALSHVQAINQMFKQKLPTDRDLPFSMLKFAKKNLENTLDANLANNGALSSDKSLFSTKNNLQDTLGAIREMANKTTKDRISTFEKTPGKSGKLANTIFYNLQNNKLSSEGSDHWISDFMPSKSNMGVNKFNQLADMLGGDRQQAANLIKSNHFQDVYHGNELNMNKFINKYNKLPLSQKEWLFTPEEQQSINLFSKLGSTDSTLSEAIKNAASSSIGQWPMSLMKSIGNNLAGSAAENKHIANWAIKKALGRNNDNTINNTLQNIIVPQSVNANGWK